MKILYFMVFLFLPAVAHAADYFLEYEKVCTSAGNKLDFVCDPKVPERAKIFNEGKKWYGKNKSGSVFELAVIKNDEFILVLENPVYFNGTSTIHIMKKTNKFYWSEFAYSDILNENEATVRYGSVAKVNK